DLKLHPVKLQEVTQKHIDETIENIRLHHAEWETISDRPVQEGDFVNLDIDAIEEPGFNICKDTSFEVKEGKMGAWMRKLIIGLNVNESAEGISEKEKTNTETECEECVHNLEAQDFKPTHCRLTVKTIKKAILPALDEALAKKVGCDSVEQLRER